MTNSRTYYSELMRRTGSAALMRRMRFNPSIRSIAKDVVVCMQAEEDINSTITDEEAKAFMNTHSAQGIITQAQAQQPTVKIDYNLLAKEVVAEQNRLSSS